MKVFLTPFLLAATATLQAPSQCAAAGLRAGLKGDLARRKQREQQQQQQGSATGSAAATKAKKASLMKARLVEERKEELELVQEEQVVVDDEKNLALLEEKLRVTMKKRSHARAAAGSELALSTKKTATATLPPEFWMWKTTPAPAAPPGPYASVVWVAHTAPPLPTIAPSAEACYGCDCLFLFPEKLIKGGSVAPEYLCKGDEAVPEIRWAGTPKNSGVGHEITRSDGKGTCSKSLSFAIVMEDLDYPNGVGESTNRVFNQFWAANIPGNYTSFNQADVHKTYKGQKLIHIGRNGNGRNALASLCPKKGVHRYRLTVWVLRDYLGSGDDPLPADTTFAQALPMLEKLELARATVYGNVKGGY